MAKNKKVENLTPDQSTFTGGAFANFFRGLLSGFVTLITFGLAYPAMVCWRMRWEASHTYINGRRLVFDGKARQLFGNYIKWVLLSIITLGIYFLIKGRLLIIEWQTKHIHFEGVEADEENNQSHFDGKWYQLFGINFVANLVTVITLTIGFYWAHCYKERWYAKHKTIDGHTMYFDGTGMQYFGKRILWTLLTIVTLGIYSFWLIVKSKKWTISHTFVEDAETLPPVSDINDESTSVSAETGKSDGGKNKLVVIVCVCSVVLALAAVGLSVYFGLCNADRSPEAKHTHNYQWVDNKDGTHKQHCGVDGCNEPDINVGSHNFSVNDICVCGSKKPVPDKTYAELLAFYKEEAKDFFDGFIRNNAIGNRTLVKGGEIWRISDTDNDDKIDSAQMTFIYKVDENIRALQVVDITLSNPVKVQDIVDRKVQNVTTSITRKDVFTFDAKYNFNHSEVGTALYKAAEIEMDSTSATVFFENEPEGRERVFSILVNDENGYNITKVYVTKGDGTEETLLANLANSRTHATEKGTTTSYKGDLIYVGVDYEPEDLGAEETVADKAV